MISKVEKGTYAGYDVNNTLASTIDELVDTAAEAVRAIRFAITQERFKAGKNKGELRWKNSLNKFATGSWDVAGKIKGIPLKNLRKLLGAAVRPFVKKKKKRKKIGG